MSSESGISLKFSIGALLVL